MSKILNTIKGNQERPGLKPGTIIHPDNPPMTTHKPTAPANRADLKTWTIEQLTYAAPFWIARLEKQMLDDQELVNSIKPLTQLHLDALKIKGRTEEQLRYWKLVLSDGIRVLPPSLRTFKRYAQPTPMGYVRRNSNVGSWDKAAGIWD